MNKNVEQSKMPLFFILLVTLALFRSIVNFDFVWDDINLISKNPYINEHINLYKIFTSSLWKFSLFNDHTISYYRPMVTLVYMLEFKLFGLFAGWYHLVNLSAHLLNIVMVWELAPKFKFSKWGQIVSTFLFALHPIQIPTICFISSHGDFLAMFFSLLAIHFWFFDKPIRWISLLWILLAMLSKETAVVLPLIIFLLDWVVREKSLVHREKWFALSVWIFYFVLRYYGLKEVNSDLQTEGPIWATLGSFRTLSIFGRIFFPLPAYPLGVLPDLNTYQIILFHIIFILIVGFTFVKTRTKSTLFFLATWFFMSTLLISDWPNYKLRFSDQLLYAAMLPISLLFGFFVKKQKEAFIILGILISFLVVTSGTQIAIWQNDETLYAEGFKRYPLNPTKSLLYAVALYNSGKQQKGCELMNYTFQLAKKQESLSTINTSSLFFNLGNCNLSLNPSIAEMYYKKSIESDENNIKSQKNLVLALMMQKKIQEAVFQAKILVEKNPDHQCYLILSNALNVNGNLQESKQAAEKAAALQY